MGGRVLRAAGGNPGGPLISGLAACVLLGASAAVGADAPPVAHPNPSACRPLADDRARLRCYDEAVDAAHTAGMPAATDRSAAALDGEGLFGKPPEESRTLSRQELGLADPASLDATVARIARNAAGKLVITLRNGQVWTQLDTTTLHLAPGDPVRISKAALGSYLLQKQSGGRSLRVRRAQ